MWLKANKYFECAILAFEFEECVFSHTLQASKIQNVQYLTRAPNNFFYISKLYFGENI